MQVCKRLHFCVLSPILLPITTRRTPLPRNFLFMYTFAKKAARRRSGAFFFFTHRVHVDNYDSFDYLYEAINLNP